MTVLAWLFGFVALVVAAVIVVSFLNRFYRKSSRDVAIIRTGFGGQKILISGGCLALPILHKVDEINLRTIRIEVLRIAEKSLITEDRMRVDAELEFYVRVLPSVEGVATAAQSLGSKAFNTEGIRNLLEGRFIDAVQAVAASLTMDQIHEKRSQFVAEISSLLKDNLAENGVALSSVSLTRLDQTAFSSLDENNAFNSVGMRRLAEIIAVNRKKRVQIEAEADIAVRHTQLDATKQRLMLSQEEEEAQIRQRLEVEKIKAKSESEGAEAREVAQAASESARINREQEIRLREIQKQRELNKTEIESQLNSAVRKIDSSIALAAKNAEEASAQAAAELARVEVILAQEKVQTDRERASADRSLEMALKRVKEAGEVAEATATTETTIILKHARAEAEATLARAQADKERMLAESEGSRAMIESENALSSAVLNMKLEQYRLDRLPEIMSQMMKPVEKIDSIRINHVSGFGSTNGSDSQGTAGSGGSGKDKPPVTQVMDSVLGMALQLPALKSIGDQIGVDLSGAIGSAAKPKSDNDTTT